MKPSAAGLAALQTLARHTPMVVLSTAGVVLGATEAAARTLGCACAAGQNWSELCADAPAQTRAYLADCARTLDPILGAFRRDIEGRRVRFRCEGYAVCLPDEAERVIVLQLRRQDPQSTFIALGQKIEELNVEVLRRQTSERLLCVAKAEADMANRAKDEFLAMLGHELRNPLAPISTALHLMQLRGVGVERERVIIERQVKHLVRLVDDLLDVSRITSGKIELKREQIELGAVIARAIELVSPLLEKREHDLVLDVPARGLLIEANPARLAQVISNLLQNAAKYSEHGGRLWVSGRLEAATGEVILAVRDAGTGIAPEMLPRVFDLFIQERQSLDRSQGGLGIGLAIVRSLVELHGGSVAVYSEGRGRGTEFTIRLPASARPEPAVGDRVAGERQGADPARHRILVVDDNQDGADLLSEALHALGHATQVAYDGPAALRIAREFAPQVALLDLGLPVMNGYELAERLRQEPGLEQIQLVAVTGYGREDDRQQSGSAGFDAHLVKPVDIERLGSLVSELLDRAAL